MIADAWTVMWKEWKEYFAAEGRRRSLMRFASLVLVLALVAVRVASAEGRGALGLVLALFMPPLITTTFVMSVVADSFAGERERHTLETMLASRLSDRAILLGKVAAVVSYGLAMGLVVMTLGVAFAVFRGARMALDPRLIGVSLGAALLLALLFTGVGVLMSLRAQTVRQAQQGVALTFMVLYFAVFAGPALFPAQVQRVTYWFEAAGPARAGATIATAFLAVDLLLLALARARFRRAKLVAG